MSNGETLTDKRPDQEVSSEQPQPRKYISVEIKLADNHYVARFQHGEPRVFHNMPQLLTAIEVECAKLGQGPTPNT